MKKLWNWFKSSNRYLHFGLGIICGLPANDIYCAVYGGLGVSLALEFKDQLWGGKPDPIDAGLTFAGMMIGYFIREGVLSLF